MQLLSIILPCCNEEGALGLLPDRLFPVLHELARTFTLELICVDDGSTDATWVRLEALCADAPCPVVLGRHPQNQGLGAALRTGQQLASGAIIATIDVDGTYPFDILLPLTAAIAAGAAVATASPYHRAGGVAGVSPLRLLFSRGASLCYRVLVDRQIATYTALVRAYRAETLATAIPDETGFLHVAMTLVEARRHGARIVEVPAILAQRRIGVSKARVARITRAHLRYLGRLLLLRATGRFWLAAVPQGTPVEGTAGMVRHG